MIKLEIGVEIRHGAVGEAVGRGGGSASLPCLIINAPNRNEAGIPVLTRQDRPIEIVSLYIPLWFVCTEDRAHCLPIVRNMSELFSIFERQISRNSAVHIS